MAISDEDIQKVREASDIVSIIGDRVPLTQRGRDFWCSCPFHVDKTPSLKIDGASQLWHCFSCEEGGDVFAFVMKADDVSFPDAVRSLAERAHIDIHESGKSQTTHSQKARLRQVCAATDKFYHEQLMRGKSEQASQARNYLSKRNLGGNIPKKWHLGFAPGNQQLVRHLSSLGFSSEEMITANVAVSRNGKEVRDRFFNRVMFPICDLQGECIAFGGRVIGDGEPKYLNSQETPLFHKSNVLYGLDKAKASMASTGDALVVEGYTDVIALHEAGIENAVATLGTALTLQHIRALSKHASKRIIYLFDGDEAGKRAADRALTFINEDMTPEAGKTRIELYAVTLPDDLDPADFIAERGADELRTLLDKAQPLVLYGIQRRLAAHDLSRAEGRTRALSDALSVLAPIKESLLAKDYAIQIAGRLQMREQDVLDALARLRPPRAIGQTDAASRNQDKNADTAAASVQESLPEGEKNRRRFERRLLSLFAQNPSVAYEHADALSQTQWHGALHEQLAQHMLAVLEKQPQISAAALISQLSEALPRMANILTAAYLAENENLNAVVQFLIEELEIGDLESSLNAMRAQLNAGDNADPEERDIMFRAAVDLQNVLNAKRAAHKPLV